MNSRDNLHMSPFSIKSQGVCLNLVFHQDRVMFLHTLPASAQCHNEQLCRSL